MTTMASSTTRPVARVMPNNVSELMEKPKILTKAKVPISETGIVTAGMMVARQSSKKKKDDQNDDDDRFFEGGDDFLYGVTDDGGGIEGDDVFDSRRKGLRKFQQLGLGGFVHVESVGVRELLHADADGSVTAVEQVGVVVFGADFGAAYVLKLNDAVGRVLQDDAFKFAAARITGRQRAG